MKNHAKGRDLRVDLSPADVDTLEIALRDLNRDLRNHLFKQLRRSTPFDLATFIMDVTGMENTCIGTSRILLWDEVREKFSPAIFNRLENDQTEMTEFEILVINTHLSYMLIHYFPVQPLPL